MPGVANNSCLASIIYEEGDVVVVASATGLIHANDMDRGHIHLGTGCFDMVINDPPQALVGFPY